jgi:phosphoribosyl-dephospho-CoA transferase
LNSMPTLPALQRHQLVWLHASAWQVLLQAPGTEEAWDEQAAACLQHWAAHDLPLVVTRQSAIAPRDALTLGLAAPAAWGRQRLFIQALRSEVRRWGHFPEASVITGLLPAAQQALWADLCAALASSGIVARVYGSHGWQAISGLAHVHAASDIDLLLHVADAQQADRAVQCLAALRFNTPRLDGELLFADGAAVAWREWQAWRAAGSHSSLLVKRLRGAAMVGAAFMAAQHESQPA